MKNNMATIDDVKKSLNVNSIREVSGDKLVEFFSLVPSMDKELAVETIRQFPEFNKNAALMLSHLKETCNQVMLSNDHSQMEAINSYKFIINELAIELHNDNLSIDERNNIAEKMVELADKIASINTENKQFLRDILSTVGNDICFVLVIGLSMLGGRGGKLPKIK